MPKADVRSRIPFVRTLDDIVSAKKRWGVSTGALAYWLHKLGILSDWQYRMFCIQINQKGYRTQEPHGLPREESVVWKAVFTALWNDRISKSQIASKLHLPADELENLVFGLTGEVKPPDRSEGKPRLKSV
jgi:Zn-dependent peptidase ImmA (M78 family)